MQIDSMYTIKKMMELTWANYGDDTLEEALDRSSCGDIIARLCNDLGLDFSHIKETVDSPHDNYNLLDDEDKTEEGRELQDRVEQYELNQYERSYITE